MGERNRKLDELNDWLQVVATVGVIASIVFLGLELRQNSDLMRAQIYQARAEIIQETFTTLRWTGAPASASRLAAARMNSEAARRIRKGAVTWTASWSSRTSHGCRGPF